MDDISIRDEVSPALERALDSLRSPVGLLNAVGGAVRLAIIDHFKAMSNDLAFHRTAATLGAPPTGVYSAAAESTTLEVSGESATITVHDERAAHRYYGGVIAPINAKNLAIPAQGFAYGKTTADFGDRLSFGYAPNKWGRWQACLKLMETTSPERTAARRRFARARAMLGADIGGSAAITPVMFWLVNHAIEQDPDPTVMPDDETLRAVVGQAADSYLARRFAGG